MSHMVVYDVIVVLHSVRLSTINILCSKILVLPSMLFLSKNVVTIANRDTSQAGEESRDPIQLCVVNTSLRYVESCQIHIIEMIYSGNQLSLCGSRLLATLQFFSCY